jgi:uncharacterized protein YkwD
LAQVAQQQAEEIVKRRRFRSPSAEVVSEQLRQVGYAAYDWRETFAVLDPNSTFYTASRKVISRLTLDSRYLDLGVGTAVAGDVTLHVFLFGLHWGDYFANATAQLADRLQIAAEMLARINEVRRRAGLSPLAPNPLLDQVSQEHAEDMLRRSYSGHRTPEGLDPSDRARASGYLLDISENIVEQRFSVQEALDAWLSSPGHRKQILNPGSREVGLGLAVGAGYDAAPVGFRVIWVQSFGLGG